MSKDEIAARLEKSVKFDQDMDKIEEILKPYGDYLVVIDTPEEILTKTNLNDHRLFHLCVTIIKSKVDDLAALLRKTQREVNELWHRNNPENMGK